MNLYDVGEAGWHHREARNHVNNGRGEGIELYKTCLAHRREKFIGRFDENGLQGQLAG